MPCTTAPPPIGKAQFRRDRSRCVEVLHRDAPYCCERWNLLLCRQLPHPHRRRPLAPRRVLFGVSGAEAVQPVQRRCSPRSRWRRPGAVHAQAAPIAVCQCGPGSGPHQLRHQRPQPSSRQCWDQHRCVCVCVCVCVCAYTALFAQFILEDYNHNP
jgi:hypothetical protein